MLYSLITKKIKHTTEFKIFIVSVDALTFFAKGNTWHIFANNSYTITSAKNIIKVATNMLEKQLYKVVLKSVF